jgi:proline dehydrogenase
MNFDLAKRVSGRFIAGQTEAEAAETVRVLNARGITATVDVLGESVTDANMASAAAARYLNLIDCWPNSISTQGSRSN